jgi:transposase
MIPDGLRVFLCAHPVDMRRSFEGLATLVVEKLHEDPTAEGALFVFINMRRDRAKLLWRDATGFCILYKRLDGRVFAVPDAPAGTSRVALDLDELAMLLDGGFEEAPRRPTPKEVARAARALARARVAHRHEQLEK